MTLLLKLPLWSVVWWKKILIREISASELVSVRIVIFCPTSTGEFLDVPDGYDQVDIFRMLMRCLGGVRERRKRRQKYDLAGTIQLIKEAKKILVLTGAGISGILVLHFILSYNISSIFDESISDKNDTKVNPLLQYPVAFPTSVPVMAFMLN